MTNRLFARIRSLPADYMNGFGVPVRAEIEVLEDDTGILLILYKADGQGAGDTWYLKLDDAKESARSQFGIRPEDWLSRRSD